MQLTETFAYGTGHFIALVLSLIGFYFLLRWAVPELVGVK